MNSSDDRFFVITGGPGSGKSTLLQALAARGYACMEEGGRAIIRSQVAIGGSALPWADRELFAELMLSWELRSYEAAAAMPAPVFFDRGVPDVAGYLRLIGSTIPDHVERAARMTRYSPLVFIAPPWQEIFGQDAERKQDFAEAVTDVRCAREDVCRLWLRSARIAAELRGGACQVRAGRGQSGVRSLYP